MAVREGEREQQNRAEQQDTTAHAFNMSPSQILKKPRLVVMGSKEYAVDDYVAEFEKDFDFTVLDAQNREEALVKLPELVKKTGPIDAFIIRVGTAEFEPFDEALLRPLAPSCRIVASASAGYDEFDVEWMTRNGMWFCNTRDAVSEATADMAVLLALGVVRDAFRAERGARSGSWKQGGIVPSRDPSGMTLGLVGMGSIGKLVARKAAAFNMRVRYYNRRRLGIDDEAEYNARYCPSLHELLAQSDVVSLHCPLTPKTEGLMSRAEFAAMKDGAFLVNTARGGLVDEDALVEALESGKLARAGLDVFRNEPDIREYFRTSDRVICMPHAGAATDEAFRRADRECLENLRAWLHTGTPVSPVNHVVVVDVPEGSDGGAPSDLVRDVDGHVEVVGPRPHQARVLLEHAARADEVEGRVVGVLAALDDALRHVARLDAADGADEHGVADGGLDLLGKGRLVARAALDLLLRVVAAGRDVEDVDAALGQEPGQAHALVDGPARAAAPLGVGVEPVGGADAHKQRHVLGDDGAHLVDELEREARAVLEAAAVLVRPLVDGRREEARHEVAVRKVQLDDVEARAHGAARRRHEVALELRDLGEAHGPRRRVVRRKGLVAGADDVVGPAADLGRRRRARAQPGRDRRGLAPGVRELDRDARVLAVRKVDVLLERVDVRVEPDARVLRGDASVGLHGRGLDHHEAGLAATLVSVGPVLFTTTQTVDDDDDSEGGGGGGGSGGSKALTPRCTMPP
ncbi:2-hydroxyacid dehydrogenase [Purpureocillium lavendulum]|uniref:2-hydroxyacid dehydrogenase n=1 Tax=Purpureocillium lavendulum TaxID=1247861 RepID=A0AB34G4X1_9HYPO|nr:2-hydroxyacid dehydrogenase [Purpureocillium lavendulum]